VPFAAGKGGAMPELPDVEVRRRYFEETSLGREVERVSVPEPRILKGGTPASLGRGLRRSRFVSARRRGKYLLAATDRGSTLLLHFGMGGELAYRDPGAAAPDWSRVVLHFTGGGRLHYTNLRLFGKVELFDTARDEEIPDIAKLGPEPLDPRFTLRKFSRAVSGRRSTIHQVLMDQELVAGIGNIFSDEITFQAGVRPDRRADDLTEDEVRLLYDRMKWTLRTAVRLDADLDGRTDRFIIPNRRKGGICPRGNAELATVRLGGRTSYYCPACQK